MKDYKEDKNVLHVGLGLDELKVAAEAVLRAESGSEKKSIAIDKMIDAMNYLGLETDREDEITKNHMSINVVHNDLEKEAYWDNIARDQIEGGKNE